MKTADTRYANWKEIMENRMVILTVQDAGAVIPLYNAIVQCQEVFADRIAEIESNLCYMVEKRINGILRQEMTYDKLKRYIKLDVKLVEDGFLPYQPEFFKTSILYSKLMEHAATHHIYIR